MKRASALLIAGGLWLRGTGRHANVASSDATYWRPMGNLLLVSLIASVLCACSGGGGSGGGAPGAQAPSPSPTPTPTPPPGSTGLEWSGNESTIFERRIVFTNPFPIYPATYVFSVFPRKKDTGPNARYYTTFFWGNNGNFVWDGGSGNTYYGMHPYPTPAPLGPGQWEISIRSNDFVTGSEVQWDRWYTQVIRVWRESASTTRHEFYWDWPDKTKLLQQTINDSTWAATNPPRPAIVVGQAPNFNGQSWGGYAGFEEFKGIIRGMQFYNSLLTLPQIDSELAAPGSAVRPWYLNLNPTPADIGDKSGSNHHPVWEGADRPALWTN